MGSGAIRSDQMARVLEHVRKIGRLVWVGMVACPKMGRIGHEGLLTPRGISNCQKRDIIAGYLRACALARHTRRRLACFCIETNNDHV